MYKATVSVPDNFENQDDFLNELKLITIILKITGVLPLYSKISSFKIKLPDTPQVVYSFCIKTVILLLTVFILYGRTYFKMMSLNGRNGDTDNINKWIEIFLCITTYSATLIISSGYSKKHISNINQILQLDKEILEYFGVRIPNNCSHFKYYILLIFILHMYVVAINVSAIFSPTLKNLDKSAFYLNILMYTFENITCAIFIVFLTAILNIITARFQFVNNALKECVSSQNYGKHCINDILFSFKLHTKLSNIMKETNDLSGIILLTFMGYAFYKVTTDSYNTFIEFSQLNSSNLMIQHCVVWLTLNIFLLVLITGGCGALTSQANETSQILSRSYGKDKTFKNIIDKFLTKSINQELEFTAYGFFGIDNSTLFTILSAVTTYLVILIQFQQLEE